VFSLASPVQYRTFAIAIQVLATFIKWEGKVSGKGGREGLGERA